MAEEEKEEGESKAEGKSKKKLIIIIVVAVLLIGGGVGAFLALGHGKAEEGAEDGAADEEDAGEAEHGGEEAQPAILALDTFIVNLQVKGSFLKTTIQLQMTEPEVSPAMESEVPKIRDTIIRILSSKLASDILSVEGKEALREEIKTSVNEALGGEEVTEVFFTEFIVQ